MEGMELMEKRLDTFCETLWTRLYSIFRLYPRGPKVPLDNRAKKE